MSSENVHNSTDTVVIIAGVTASGKSALASELMSSCSVAVINADSKQVYKCVPILTAQPSDVLMSDLYNLYSYIDLDADYSVSSWLRDASQTIEFAFSTGKVPVLIGGSGMYISSLMNGLSNIPSVSELIKIKVISNMKTMGRKAFYDYYSSKDDNIKKININDTYRIVRMAQIFEETGVSLFEFHKNRSKYNNVNYNIKIFLIIPESSVTNRNIKSRIDNMINNDAIGEVQTLIDMNVAHTKASMDIYGIKEISAYLNNRISLEEAKSEILIRTIKYAKRQRTWFRNQYAGMNIFTNINSAKNSIISSIMETQH